MHRARAFLSVAFSIVSLAASGLEAAPGSGTDHPVAIASGQSVNGSWGMIVMAGGDVFSLAVDGRTCESPLHPWVFAGNVFASAGRGSLGPIVGMNQNYQLLTADGDWFQGYAYGGPPFTFLGNVFEMTGVRAAGEDFVMFGGSTAGQVGNEYGVTNYGNVFRWDHCSPSSSWSFVGTIPENGPVGTNRSSWGRLKIAYR